MPAYALFSSACFAAMAVDPVALGMTRYSDMDDGINRFSGYVHDLVRRGRGNSSCVAPS